MRVIIMGKLTDDQAKEQHIKDGKKAMLELQSDTRVKGVDKDYRNKCLIEFIVMIENGNNDHINTTEEGKKEPDHFK